MVSTSSGCLSSSGVWGLSVRKGSMMICSPPGVVKIKAECPRYVILVPPSISCMVYLHPCLILDRNADNVAYAHGVSGRSWRLSEAWGGRGRLFGSGMGGGAGAGGG